MGHNTGFATEFYANPGITMSIFNPLEMLDWSKRSQGLKEELAENIMNIEDLEGYYDLVNCYVFTNHVILSEALSEFGQTNLFKRLNTKKNFQFHIGEHDTDEIYPLWTNE